VEKEIIFDNSRIYYRSIGNGSTVILIHGFGEDGEVWRNQIEFLKNSYQLVIPDLPGTGRSEMIEDMSMEGMAEVIKTIIDKETPPNSSAKVAMIGHSMGGYIALAFAEKYDALLNSFGLFHSTAYADSEEKKQVRRKGIEFIEQHGAFEFLKTTTPNLFSQQTKDERPILIDEQISGMHNFSSLALVSYYNAMINRPDRRDILKKMNVPVLFVIGEHDNAVSPQDSLQQTHLPENSYIHILAASGHMGMLEEAEKCNRLLKIFLKSTTTSLT
jgi:pimeloyl-ACP methyl ester carboxylesterase